MSNVDLRRIELVIEKSFQNFQLSIKQIKGIPSFLSFKITERTDRTMQ